MREEGRETEKQERLRERKRLKKKTHRKGIYLRFGMQNNFSLPYTGFVKIQQGVEQPRKIRSSFPKKPKIHLCNYRHYQVIIMHALVIIGHTVLTRRASQTK